MSSSGTPRGLFVKDVFVLILRVFACMCLSGLCVCPITMEARRGDTDPLELDLEVVVGGHVGMRPKSQSFAKAAGVLDL